MSANPMVHCENLVKIYRIADIEVVALQGLDLRVEAGEMLALVGTSGSGKSSLLNILGGLDEPTAGVAMVGGQDLAGLDEKGRVHHQRSVVGFMWQQPARNLLPYLSAWENVALPMMLQGGRRRASLRRARALELLDIVDMVDRAHFKPDRLSGGQQQRVALAMAMANDPPLLLADEPTGQVDGQVAGRIFTALRQINEQAGTTIIIVTHDQRVANQVDRVAAIRDGRITTEILRQRDGSNGAVTEEEWVVLDRAGRLQMPQTYIDTLELRERVRLHLENDHVSVWPQPLEAATIVSKPPSNGVSLIRSLPKSSLQAAAGRYSTQPRKKRLAVSLRHLSRTFRSGVEDVTALDGVSLEIAAGVMAVIKGPSGSGKTTLLNIIAGLDDPTEGSVILDGYTGFEGAIRPVDQLDPAEKIELRRHEIGFVFQTFGLLSFLTVRENVEVPLRLVRAFPDERQARVDHVLALVGLEARASHRIYELSGGEQQRVALARALANEPSLILADEPTGQLDTATGHDIIALLREIIRTTGVTAIIASHDPKVVAEADMVFSLDNGRLLPAASPTPA